MRIPRVNPIGLVEEPEDYVSSPRTHPVPVRIAAALLLAVFLAVVCATTVASLGAYCLTTDTANVYRLPRRSTEARERWTARSQPRRSGVSFFATRARRSARR